MIVLSPKSLRLGCPSSCHSNNCDSGRKPPSNPVAKTRVITYDRRRKRQTQPAPSTQRIFSASGLRRPSGHATAGRPTYKKP
jgi:hypothetical protein